MKLTPPNSPQSPGTATQVQAHTCDILVIDAEPKTSEVVRKAAPENAGIRVAASADQAMLELKRKPADLVLISMQIQDNAGAGLIEKISKAFPRTMMVALSRSHTADACLSAIRAGAGDVIFSPLKVEETRNVIANSLRKNAVTHKQAARNTRLRTVCRRLNKARHEISAQVDLLCNDLVRAYQDLASQLNQTQAMSDFAVSIETQTGLEDLMRATLEWILKKLGPINAAVMLPNSENEYSLGAYLNLDTPATDAFIGAIGSTIAPQAASGGLLAFEKDGEIDDMFGPPAAPLQGRSWLAHSCQFRNECLGVLIFFRTQGTSFDPATGAMLQAIAPLLGEQIGKLMQKNSAHSSSGQSPYKHRNRFEEFGGEAFGE